MTLGIVVVAYQRPMLLRALIASIQAQSVDDWKMIILHDGPEGSSDFNGVIVNMDNPVSGKIRSDVTAERRGAYGHPLREEGIKRIKSDWLLITNDDNYYAPVFIERMMAKAKPDVSCVLCDMVHNHPRKDYLGRAGKASPYGVLVARPRRHFADIGCFIVPTAVAKKVGFPWRDFDGDGLYLEAVIKAQPGKRVAKVPQVLFVHN
jgi:GT2 family glycosyltransferase